MIANGDVTGLAEARACLEASGRRGGHDRPGGDRPPLARRRRRRGAGRTPVGYADRAEQAALAAEHYAGLLSLYGPAMGVRHARKHLAAYAETGGGLSPAERTTLLTTTAPEAALALLARAFAGPAPMLRAAA